MATAVQKRLRPALGYLISTAPNSSAISLSAAATLAAFSFVVPSSGKTLANLRFFLTGVTGSLGANDLVCALYSDNGGKPGTLIESHALGSVPAGNTWITFNGFTTALTAGGQYWAVLSNANATPATNYPSYLLASSLSIPWATGNMGGWGWQYCNSTNGGTTWSAQSAGYAGYRIGYADLTYDGHVAQAVNGGPAVYGTLMEGVRFTSPANAIVNVSGAAFEIRTTSGLPGNLKIALYTGATPTLVAVSNTIPAADVAGTTAWLQADFVDGEGNPLTVSLQPGTDCRLVFLDSTSSDPSNKFWQTSEITFDADSCSSGTVNLMPFDGTAKKTFFNGATWADTANVLMPFALLVDSNAPYASQQINQPPPAPTLTIADKGDGTGATATIAGGDAGASNAVYVSPLPSATGNVAYTQAATIAGNASGNLALTPGAYLAYAEATENALNALPSNTVFFRTTGGGLSSRIVTPSGHQGIFIAGVAYLIASSPNFRALVGAADAAHALPFVKLEADDTEESGSSRPRVIVSPSPQFALHKLSLQKFRPAGGVWVSFELPPSLAILSESPREDRLWDETLDFYNQVDPILADCMALQGTGTGYVPGQSHVALHQIELLDGPSAVNEVREAGEHGEVAQYFYGATYFFHFNG